MNLTNELLSKCYPLASDGKINKFLPYINRFCNEYEINTIPRLTAFLAQCGYETAQLRWIEEIWGPSKAQSGYKNRKDLGNTTIDAINIAKRLGYSDVGKLYKGRGLIQLTGYYNYLKASQDLKVNLVGQPENVSSPYYATLVSCWFWEKNNLNKYADSYEFTKITRKINGGTNGIGTRLKLYNAIFKTLKDINP